MPDEAAASAGTSLNGFVDSEDGETLESLSNAVSELEQLERKNEITRPKIPIALLNLPEARITLEYWRYELVNVLSLSH